MHAHLYLKQPRSRIPCPPQVLVGVDGNSGLRGNLASLSTQGCSSCTNGAAFRSTVVRSCDTLIASLNSMAAAAPVADDLQSLKDAIASALPDVQDVLAQARIMQDAISGMPNLNVTIAQITRTRATTLAFNQTTTSKLMDTLDEAETSIDSGPLLSHMAAVIQLQQVTLPCIARAFDALDNINHTLFNLPSSVDDVYAALASVNSTFTSLPNLSVLANTVSTFNRAFADMPDLAPFRGNLTLTATAISNLTSAVDLSILLSSVTAVNTATTKFNALALVNVLTAVNFTLVTRSPTAQEVANVRAMDGVRDDLLAALQPARAQVNGWNGDLPAPDMTAATSALTLFDTARAALNPAQLTSMDAVGTALAGVNGTAKIADANALDAAARNTTHLGTYRIELFLLYQAIRDVPDLTPLINSWDSITGAVRALPNLVSLRASVITFGNALNDLPERELFDKVGSYLTRAGLLLGPEGDALLARMQKDQIAPVFQAQGLMAGARAMVAIIDDAQAMANFTYRGYSKVSEDPNVQKVLRKLDVVGNSWYSERGAVYFFASLVLNEDKLLNATFNSTQLVGKNTSYPSLSMWVGSVVFDSDKAKANISRKGLYTALFAIPGAIILLGLLSCLLNVRGLSACMLVLVLIAAPLMFLLAGALSFPLVVVTADGCRSSENLAYKYLLMKEGTDRTMTFNNVTITINPPALYAQIAGGCKASGASTPLASAWASAQQAFGDFVPRKVDEWLNPSNTSLVRPRELLAYPITDMAHEVGTQVSTLIQASSSLASCSALANAYFSFKDAACCTVAQPIYLLIASWYLLAFTFMCCGPCAGLLGATRFRRADSGHIALSGHSGETPRIGKPKKKPLALKMWARRNKHERQVPVSDSDSQPNTARRPPLLSAHEITSLPATPPGAIVSPAQAFMFSPTAINALGTGGGHMYPSLSSPETHVAASRPETPSAPSASGMSVFHAAYPTLPPEYNAPEHEHEHTGETPLARDAGIKSEAVLTSPNHASSSREEGAYKYDSAYRH
eukprot:jgi/Chlat1/4346/Chrsp29S04493